MSGYPTARAISKTAGRDRILVGGQDVTFFRDKRTPMPGYLLTEPFAYGSTRLVFPQVHASLEATGTGDLSWCRKGARVEYRRVDESGDPIATDYVGVVIAINVDGRELSLDIGGEFSGPAGLLNEQRDLFHYTNDVGHWAQLAAAKVNLAFDPWFGPSVGIRLTHNGEQSLLGWAQQVCTMSQTNAGVQRALMPSAWGSRVWSFEEKDYTTKHLTLYTDDARVVAKLSDDASEQPNTFYGTGVSPQGVRFQNARYPRIIQGPAPAYPMAGGASFGVGTVNADTIDGSGITTLRNTLVFANYIDFDEPFTGTYDTVIRDAVKELQDDAGLTVTGTMTTATWDALYDLSVTGYSLNGSKIHPLVQASNVRKWNYTRNGGYAGRNPDYDPHVLQVDRNIDFGAGVTKARALAYCRGQRARTSAKNWVGTIRLNGSGAFSGEHAATSVAVAALTSADLMSLRDIRPGMNAWLPLFDGGTLVHIAGVAVDADGAGATLTVDTQARDLMELSEIIARNRESRRDVRREWNAANRGGKTSGNMITRDEYFGHLDRSVPLDGDTWTVIPILAGQSGQVNRIDLSTYSSAAAFCVAVFSKKVTRKQLNRRIGNPFPVNGDGESVWETTSLTDWYDDRVLLYAAGDERQPCGYWPRKHTNDTGGTTSHPITGDFRDDGSFAYLTNVSQGAVLWLAIYPDRDTHLRRGQVLYPQLDDAI